MLVAFTPNTPKTVLDKFQRLLSGLQSIRDYAEAAAARITIKEFKFSILELAQEVRQYSNELIAHLETLSGEHAGSYKAACNNLHRDTIDGADVYELMDLNVGEKFIVKKYQDVLNEPFLAETSRKMVRYQLNGVMYLLSKLKLAKFSLQGARGNKQYI